MHFPHSFLQSSILVAIAFSGFNLSSCASLADKSEQQAQQLERGVTIEDLQAPNPELKQAWQQALAGEAESVTKMLVPYNGKSPLERAWRQWLLGEAWYELGAFDKSQRLLQGNYETLRDMRPITDPATARVLAKSLQVLGKIYRQKGEIMQAFALHQLQLDYLQKYGNAEDQVSALVSLANSASELKNPYVAEKRLVEASLLLSNQKPGQARERQKIVIMQNLAYALEQQQNFAAATRLGEECLAASRSYDASYPQENRELWALAGLADIYGSQALALDTRDPVAARPFYQAAREHAVLAIAKLDQSTVIQLDRSQIDLRMRRFCGTSCRTMSGSTEIESQKTPR